MKYFDTTLPELVSSGLWCYVYYLSADTTVILTFWFQNRFVLILCSFRFYHDLFDLQGGYGRG